MSLLEIRDLRTHLRAHGGVARAVDGVDLVVEEGESVGVVGESGSGKTLLALSVLGLFGPGENPVLPGSSIRFRGEELVGMAPERLRRVRGGGIAMVFQEPMTALNPVFTVGFQIREVLRLHRGMNAAQAREEAVRLLSEVGIPEARERAGSYPHQLSGGMRQRAMIAMALAGEPALLIADEPTTALDVTVQAQILDLLKGLQARRGMALLLISHDLAVVARVCEKVAVMYGGQVVEAGLAREVLEHPRHPYTRGLLGSRLSLHDRRKTLRPISGEVPEASRWPAGCRFHPRCSEAVDRCRGEVPELRVLQAREEWKGRCWLLGGGEGGEG